MAYTPNSIAVFCAAFAGAIGGTGASGKVPSNEDSASDVNVNIAAIALAFAEEFDTLYDGNTGSLACQTIQELCETVWQQRVPSSRTPGDYQNMCEALIALVKAGVAAAIAEGIPVNSSGGGIVQVGYDQPIKLITLFALEEPDYSPVLRSTGPDTPMNVRLPNVSPGNFLKIAWNAEVVNVTLDESQASVNFITVVLIGDSIFMVDNNSAGIFAVDPDEDALLSGMTLVEIPAEAGDEPYIDVQLWYITDEDGQLQIGGDDGGSSITSGYGSCTLEVTEYTAGVVTQPSPATLIEITPP